MKLKYTDLRSILQNERFSHNRARRVDIQKSVYNDIKEQVKGIEDLLQKNDNVDNVQNKDTDYEKKIREKFKSTHLDVQDLKRVKHHINRAVQLDFPNKPKDIIDSMIDYVLGIAEKSLKSQIPTKSIYENTVYDHDGNFDNNLRDNEDEEKILNKFSQFFREVTEDIKMLSRNNKLRCRALPISNYKIARMPDKSEPVIIKSSEIADNKKGSKLSLCKKYKICPNILINFLTEFHQMLNDTVLNSLKNYGAMYSKDVATDTTNEQDQVNDVIDNVINKMDPKIINVFENNTNSFVQSIKYDSWSQLTKDEVQKKFEEYVGNVIIKLNYVINKVIKAQFKTFKKGHAKRNLIEDDIKINMKLELGNLESNMKEKICNFFDLCSVKNRSDLNDIRKRVGVPLTTSNRKDVTAHTEIVHSTEKKPNKAFSKTTKKIFKKNFNIQQMVTRTTHKLNTGRPIVQNLNRSDFITTLILPSNDKSRQNRTVAIMTKR